MTQNIIDYSLMRNKVLLTICLLISMLTLGGFTYLTQVFLSLGKIEVISLTYENMDLILYKVSNKFKLIRCDDKWENGMAYLKSNGEDIFCPREFKSLLVIFCIYFLVGLYILCNTIILIYNFYVYRSFKNEASLRDKKDKRMFKHLSLD